MAALILDEEEQSYNPTENIYVEKAYYKTV